MTGPRHAGPRDERAMVTAETAVIVPFLVVLAVALVWLGSLGIGQVRLVDAAREAARMSARGDSAVEVEAAARSMAPDDALVTIKTEGGEHTVTIEVSSRPALPILRHLPTPQLSATAVSAAEAAAP